MPAVDRSNVQGLVAAPYPRPHARILLLAVTDAAAGRRFVAAWKPRITTAAMDPGTAPDPLANLSVTWQGLQALGAVPDPRQAGFPLDFTDGPNPSILGDHGESRPDRWWNGRFRGADVHLALHLHARTAAQLDAATDVARREAASAELRELRPVDGDGALTGEWLSPDGRELHFGYRDGFSQPALNWTDEPGRPDLLDIRHVLLGRSSAAVPSEPARPPLADLVRDGTYAVLRWLRQDAPGFERFLTERAPEVAGERPPTEAREFLAAKMMGRWRDGTPLVLSPDRPDPARATEAFGYAGDPDGLRCPFAAHIRIANRRDDPLTAANAGMFPAGTPRIVRRGMSYGPRYTGDGTEDGVERGIVGLFLCASINRQFYPLTRWMHTTDFRDAFRGGALRRQDPIVGNRDRPGANRSFAVPTAAGEVVLSGLPHFVRTCGTLFLLTPGLSGLERIAGVRA